MKQTVVIGLLGTSLDIGKRSKRWERWRPSVSIYDLTWDDITTKLL
ncbi:MAG: RNA repair transcriptional activator RtcR family protein [Desulfobacteraceae bacterium]|jgi:transcriptional regulatory protein RtcR